MFQPLQSYLKKKHTADIYIGIGIGKCCLTTQSAPNGLYQRQESTLLGYVIVKKDY